MSGNPSHKQSIRVRSETAHVRLGDAATPARVSTKTVLRVANNQGELSERIRQHGFELEYCPNVPESSLMNQHIVTLAVVAWGIEYFDPSQTNIGIEKQADELAYPFILSLISQPVVQNLYRVIQVHLDRDGVGCPGQFKVL